LAAEPSEQLRAFLRESISSYEELETLLLFAREPERAWTEAEVAGALNARLEAIASALGSLVAAGGLLEVREQAGLLRFQLALGSPSQEQVVTELLRLYAESRLTLLQLMSANALERVRGAALRRLADAFGLEKPK
jgi:hypothetical protein